MTLAPGANNESRSGGISIDGASASENRYFIDGTDTTNLRTGLSGKKLLTDFVEQIQVKSSGYAAEFGGSTGGVINVITKSGTNTFRGDFGTYFNNDSLSGDERPTLRLVLTGQNASEYVTLAKDDYSALGAVLPDRRSDRPQSPVVLRRLHAAARRDRPHGDVPLEQPDRHLHLERGHAVLHRQRRRRRSRTRCARGLLDLVQQLHPGRPAAGQGRLEQRRHRLRRPRHRAAEPLAPTARSTTSPAATCSSTRRPTTSATTARHRHPERHLDHVLPARTACSPAPTNVQPTRLQLGADQQRQRPRPVSAHRRQRRRDDLRHLRRPPRVQDRRAVRADPQRRVQRRAGAAHHLQLERVAADARRPQRARPLRLLLVAPVRHHRRRPRQQPRASSSRTTGR